MNLYKVIFAKNMVSSCQLVNRTVNMKGEYFYEHANGKLIHAIIKAGNETEAISKGEQIINEYYVKYLGKDFIS